MGAVASSSRYHPRIYELDPAMLEQSKKSGIGNICGISQAHLLLTKVLMHSQTVSVLVQ